MELGEIQYEDVDWIYLAQHADQKLALASKKETCRQA
jgi:hypothetical protein